MGLNTSEFTLDHFDGDRFKARLTGDNEGSASFEFDVDGAGNAVGITIDEFTGGDCGYFKKVEKK
jgi:hypothetical protein